MKTLAIASALSACLITAALAQDEPLPAPVSDQKIAFAKIEERKDSLKEKIVLIEIDKLLGEGTDWGKLVRFIAKDTSGSKTPYGQIAFPKEGLVRIAPLLKVSDHPFTIYAKIHVFGGEAAALSEVVGTKFTPNADKTGGTYSW